MGISTFGRVLSGRSAGDPWVSVDDRESLLIDGARVLCISFMIFTHLKEYEDSSIYGGDLNLIGVITNDYLGRASVPALSLVSGYLLAAGFMKGRGRSFASFSKTKIRTILVPMLIWNLIYIVSVVAAYLAFGHVHRVIDLARSGSVIDIVNIFTGLTEAPANFPLDFIRDFLVAQFLLTAALQWGGKFREAILAAMIIYTVFGTTDPVISREMILMFAAAGALMPLCGLSLSSLATSRSVRILCLLMIALLILAGPKLISEQISWAFSEIFLRVAMSLLIIILAYFLAQTPVSRFFHALAPYAFLTYLLHLPLTSTLWVFWQKFSGQSNDSIFYAVYYLAAPIMAWVIALGLAKALQGHPTISALLGIRAASRRRTTGTSRAKISENGAR